MRNLLVIVLAIGVLLLMLGCPKQKPTPPPTKPTTPPTQQVTPPKPPVMPPSVQQPEGVTGSPAGEEDAVKKDTGEEGKTETGPAGGGEKKPGEGGERGN